MLPIAVLPVAGLLLRLGQPDLLEHRRSSAAAGDAIFANLGLLFAVGVAVGLARDNNGAAGLAGVVCFLVATNGAETLLTVPPDALAGLTGDAARPGQRRRSRPRRSPSCSVPVGILSGLIGGRALQPLRRHQAAGLSRLLRRPAVRADRRAAWRASCWRCAFGCGYGAARATAWTRSAARVVGAGRVGPVRLRRAEPAADRHRPAPHPQQHRLVHRRRLSTARPAT